MNHPNSAAGCLSGTLRRLICIRRDSGDPPDNPPSSFQHLKNITADSTPPPPKKPPSPSLVARLMGLDSMPVHPYAPPPDSLPRSRSANSADTWTGFLSHKRAASDPPSSLSFREAPTYLQKENDDFLLLSFVPDHKVSEQGGRDHHHVSTNLGTTTAERRKRAPHKNAHRGERKAEMEQQEQETNVGESKDIRRRRRRSAYAHRKLELDQYCRSQNSSPVSVLDRRRLDGELSPETPVSGDRKARKRSSRKKLSSDLDRRGASLRIDISKKRTGNGRMGLSEGDKKNRTKGDRHDFLEMWGVICRMAEQDARATSWVSDDVGEVVSETGMQILEFLISELVLELAETV